MRHLLVTVSALGLLLASSAAFAQSGQGGAIGTNPAPATGPVGPPAQGTGGPGNTTQPYPGSLSSGGAGVGVSSGQGAPVDPNLTPAAPGKVGGSGSNHR